MAKKALCVGINDYPLPGMDLRGCVNDALGWSSLLVDHYDFAKSDVQVLMDEEATHDRVVGGIKNLLAGAAPGDVLVFTNSSHGTYLVDTDGDENSYDEAMCPYDTDERPLVDDELRQLFADIPKGVHLTVISDSCHSGSVTRAALDTPDDRRVRFMTPKVLGLPTVPDIRERARVRQEKYPESSMKELLMSGCKANQYSFDATIQGTPHGAFSFFALAAIRDADYRLTYRQLHEATVAALEDSPYDQAPQLEGADAFKDRQIFT